MESRELAPPPYTAEWSWFEDQLPDDAALSSSASSSGLSSRASSWSMLDGESLGGDDEATDPAAVIVE